MEEFKIRDMDLDDIDKKIILKLQNGIAINCRPYQECATEFGISENEVVQRLQKMKEVGFIRKNAIATNHYKLGYLYNAMTVWEVAEDKIDEVGARFAKFDFISHSYQRPSIPPEWNYTIFAMVHGKSQEEIDFKINKMKTAVEGQFSNMDILLSTKILKKTGIRLRENKNV